MLHYEPDGMFLDASALGVEDWAVGWDSEEMPGRGVLMNMIADYRAFSKGATAPLPALGRLIHSVFQPERVSGFCAAG